MSKMWDYPSRKLDSTTKSSTGMDFSFSVRVFWPTLFSQGFARLSSTSGNHLTLLAALEVYHSSQDGDQKAQTFIQKFTLKWVGTDDLIIILYQMTRKIWNSLQNERMSLAKRPGFVREAGAAEWAGGRGDRSEDRGWRGSCHSAIELL